MLRMIGFAIILLISSLVLATIITACIDYIMTKHNRKDK